MIGNVPESSMERVAQFLRLGKLIHQLYCSLDPGPYGQSVPEETPDILQKDIKEATEKFQVIAEFDDEMDSFRTSFLDDLPTTECIQLTALLAFLQTSNLHQGTTPDSLAQKASPIFCYEDQMRGLIEAKHAVGMIVEQRVLIVKGTAIHLSESLLMWLAGGNKYASFGLCQSDVVEMQGAAPSLRARRSRRTLKDRVKVIPFLTPKEISNEICKHGYVGQDHAKNAVSLSAYRHVQRLRMKHIDGVSPDTLPQKENLLLIGNTGCGKSFLIKTLFSKVLQLPTAISDSSGMTETGYVGEDANILLSNLLKAANGDQAWAECGISCIDEFDKLASASVGDAVYGGSGSRNDVSRSGVQRSLLRILEENSVVDIPAENGRPGQRSRISFDASGVLFVACGAFTEMKNQTQSKTSIGFNDQSYLSKNDDQVLQLQKYGISKELVGRFGSLINLQPLKASDLFQILNRTVIHRYTHELSLSGIDLKIDEAVKNSIVQDALIHDTGARGLTTQLLEVLDSACFDAYSSEKTVSSLNISFSSQGIEWDLLYKQTPSQTSKQSELLEA